MKTVDEILKPFIYDIEDPGIRNQIREVILNAIGDCPNVIRKEPVSGETERIRSSV